MDDHYYAVLHSVLDIYEDVKEEAMLAEAHGEDGRDVVLAAFGRLLTSLRAATHQLPNEWRM